MTLILPFVGFVLGLAVGVTLVILSMSLLEKAMATDWTAAPEATDLSLVTKDFTTTRVVRGVGVVPHTETTHE
jgi:hypothetical protein